MRDILTLIDSMRDILTLIDSTWDILTLINTAGDILTLKKMTRCFSGIQIYLGVPGLL